MRHARCSAVPRDGLDRHLRVPLPPLLPLRPKNERRLRRGVIALTLALMSVCAIGDWVTGVDVAFTLLYLVPIALGTWYRSARYGYALAAVGAAAGAVASVGSHIGWPSLVWNQCGALGTFVFVVWLVSRLRGHVAAERRERRLAVDQLRHAERMHVLGTLAAGVAHELGACTA